MKMYKGLRAILAALGLSLLALAPAHTAPRLAISPLGLQITPFEGAEISGDGQTIRGTKTHVDAISGTRTITEWEFHSEAE